jgi:divalent metal cation (Fe/Co/Zn/Cd) transporter
MTLHMGPNTLILNMDLQFVPSLDPAEIGRTIDRVERRIRDAYPEVRFVFVEAKSLTGRGASDEASSESGTDAEPR